MQKYYYNTHTKEYCGKDIPIGSGFDFTFKPPNILLDRINYNESLFYNENKNEWYIDEIKESDNKNIEILIELENKLNILDKKITILERIKDKTEKEKIELDNLLTESTKIYRKIEKIKSEI